MGQGDGSCINCGQAVQDRFCEHCGTPAAQPAVALDKASTFWGESRAEDLTRAGSVPFPQPQHYPTGPIPPRPGRLVPILAGSVLVLALVAAAVTAVLLLRRTDPPRDRAKSTPTTATPASTAAAPESEPTRPEQAGSVVECTSPPRFAPQGSVTEAEDIAVTFVVSSDCPAGQWLDTGSLRLELTGTDGTPYAGASFDLSATPVWLPPGGAGTVVAHYPLNLVWALPGQIEGAISRSDAVAQVQVRAPGAQPAPPADTATGGTAEIRALPSTGSEQRQGEQRSLAALRRLAQEDLPYLQKNIDGYWVPQISSKKLGTYDAIDDLTYDYGAIYAQHLRLRGRYANTRLVWSGDWGSFELVDYWVTMVGSPSLTGPGANRWCERQGLDWTQCFAKRLDRDGPPDGTTLSREP